MDNKDTDVPTIEASWKKIGKKDLVGIIVGVILGWSVGEFIGATWWGRLIKDLVPPLLAIFFPIILQIGVGIATWLIMRFTMLLVSILAGFILGAGTLLFIWSLFAVLIGLFVSFIAWSLGSPIKTIFLSGLIAGISLTILGSFILVLLLYYIFIRHPEEMLEGFEKYDEYIKSIA